MNKGKSMKKETRGNKLAQFISILLIGCLLLGFILPLVSIFVS
jgi:hypothetical protein